MVGAGPGAPEAAVVHAPLAVLPAPFPAASFAKACAAAPVFNALIAAVAADSEYLQATLAPAAEYDDFTVGCPRCTAQNPRLPLCKDLHLQCFERGISETQV